MVRKVAPGFTELMLVSTFQFLGTQYAAFADDDLLSDETDA